MIAKIIKWLRSIFHRPPVVVMDESYPVIIRPEVYRPPTYGITDLPVWELATPDLARGSDYSAYTVDPDKMYPATIEHLTQTLIARARPDGVLGRYYDEAATLPAEAWHAAQYAAEPGTRAIRARALELTRLWFTEHLHRALSGQPLHVHITRSPKWRL